MKHSVVVCATNAQPPRGGTGADAWASVDGNAVSVGNSPNILASFNIASVEKVAEGDDFKVTFTNPMPDANYAVVASVSSDDDRGGMTFVDFVTPQSFIVQCRNTDGSSISNSTPSLYCSRL